MAAFLRVTLLGPTSAADRKSNECGLASVYSTGGENTSSGKTLSPKISPRASGTTIRNAGLRF